MPPSNQLIQNACGHRIFSKHMQRFFSRPRRPMCVIPFCEEEACGRCLNCSPGQFLCENQINSVNAGGRSLHHREVWKVSWRLMEHSLLQSPYQLCCETRFRVVWLQRHPSFFLTTVYISSTQLLHFMKFLLNSNIHYVSKTCPTFIQRKKWNQWA